MDRSPLCHRLAEAVAVPVLGLAEEEDPVLLPAPLVDPSAPMSVMVVRGEYARIVSTEAALSLL